jgi:hypothetical protein
VVDGKRDFWASRGVLADELHRRLRLLGVGALVQGPDQPVQLVGIHPR